MRRVDSSVDKKKIEGLGISILGVPQDSIVYKYEGLSLSKIKDSSVQCIVTSPPYPMIKKWDSSFPTVDFESQHIQVLDVIWKECFRILIPGGICCINIGDATRTVDGQFRCYPNYARVSMEMVRLGFTPLVPILWKKISRRPNAFLGSGFLPTNAYIAQDCKYIGIFRKGHCRAFLPKDTNRIASAFTKEERDLWFQQIWNIPGRRGAGSTSAFPDEIPYRLIRMFSVIGDVIVDPFHGSGTTGYVARKLNRRYIGYTNSDI